MKPSSPKEVLKFRADPVLRRAIKLKAALLDVDLQDVIVEALREQLAEEILEVERRGLVSGGAAPKGPKGPTIRKKAE